jgi:prophage antirepressor-like protein
LDYWVARDVCELLEIKDVDRAIAELDPDDKSELVFRSKCSDPDSSEPKKTVVINFSGVFSLLFQSQAPIAKKFKRWIINQFLDSVFFTDEDCIYYINKSIVKEIQDLGLIPFGYGC